MLLTCDNPLTALEKRTNYPVIQCEVQEIRTGNRRGGLFIFPAACFHDLLASSKKELAGMGLSIIGNLCKLMREGETATPPRRFEPSLLLIRARGAESIRLPFPGMPDDNPSLELIPEALPFDEAMFLDADKFRRRVDRLALMRRIEKTWVPHLKELLERQT